MGMPAPDTETLKRLVAQGLSYQQIADELHRLSGYETNAKNIGVYISRNRERLGIPLRRPRYDNLIPWEVHSRHAKNYDLRMLRVLGRIQQGLPVEQEWVSRMERWREKLQAENGVVAYYWWTPDGFYWVPRRDGDLELIRPVEGVEQDAKEMSGAAS